MEITTKKNIIVEVTVVIELFLTFAGIGLFTFGGAFVPEMKIFVDPNCCAGTTSEKHEAALGSLLHAFARAGHTHSFFICADVRPDHRLQELQPIKGDIGEQMGWA